MSEFKRVHTVGKTPLPQRPTRDSMGSTGSEGSPMNSPVRVVHKHTQIVKSARERQEIKNQELALKKAALGEKTGKEMVATVQHGISEHEQFPAGLKADSFKPFVLIPNENGSIDKSSIKVQYEIKTQIDSGGGSKVEHIQTLTVPLQTLFDQHHEGIGGYLTLVRDKLELLHSKLTYLNDLGFITFQVGEGLKNELEVKFLNHPIQKSKYCESFQKGELLMGELILDLTALKEFNMFTVDYENFTPQVELVDAFDFFDKFEFFLDYDGNIDELSLAFLNKENETYLDFYNGEDEETQQHLDTLFVKLANGNYVINRTVFIEFIKAFIKINQDHLISYIKETPLEDVTDEAAEEDSDKKSIKDAQTILQDIYKKGISGENLKEKYNSAFYTFAYAPFHFIIDQLNAFFETIGGSAAHPYFNLLAKIATQYFTDHKQELTNLAYKVVLRPYKGDVRGLRSYTKQMAQEEEKFPLYSGFFSSSKFKSLDELLFLSTTDRQKNAEETAKIVIPIALEAGANKALQLLEEGKSYDEVRQLTSAGHVRNLLKPSPSCDEAFFSPPSKLKQRALGDVESTKKGAAEDDDA